MTDWGLKMLEYLYGKRFGSKIAWVSRKLRLFSSQTFSRKNTTEFSNSSHSSYLCAYEDRTECSETSEYKVQTPGSYQEESIQHSEHDEKFEIKNTKFAQ